VSADAVTPTIGRWSRHRSTLLIVGGLVLGILVVILIGGGARTAEPLDPDNPGPDGGRALARVLGDEGVEVDVVRSADALDDADPGADTTVLVTSTTSLGASTLDRLRTATSDSLLVLAAPDPAVTDLLGYEPGSSVSPTTARPAECVGSDLVTLLDGLEVSVSQGVEYAAPAGCFYGDGGALLARPADGVLLLGALDLLRNGDILEADNAAVSLRTLGQRDRLVWYVPDPADLAADEAVSLSTLLPDWVRPGVWIGVLTVLALAVWRGRRLGPLVVEPLPVVVKAIETTRSRGRLYRRAHDRGHAAYALRAAARSATAERMRLPATVDPHELIRGVAARLGRPVDEIGYLLHPAAPAPTTDHDLITLASALADLDREVRRG
jgi:Domain of unknown function (DUF4350)